MVLPIGFGLPLFATAYFLREFLESDAPTSGSYQEPYVPPFQGGQCANTNYLIRITATLSGTRAGVPEIQNGFNQFFYFGKINSVTVGAAFTGQFGYSATVFVNGVGIVNVGFGGAGDSPPFIFPSGAVPNVSSIEISGSPNNCGDPPNPNPELSPVTTGISGGGFDSGSEPVQEIEGSFLPVLPFLDLLLDIIDAIKNASNILDAIKKVGEAFESLKNLLDELRKFLDKDKKRENKSALSYQFGKVSRDGFLRLYPSSSFDGLECVQLDCLMLSIPLGYGREVGNLSPNFYRYRELGRISFVSSTFGIISTSRIEFGRTSISVPEGSVGFYYQFGLENEAIASLSALYVKDGDPITTQ